MSAHFCSFFVSQFPSGFCEQVTVRVTSHDKRELAWAFVAPLAGVLWRKIRGSPSGEDFAV